MNNIKNDHIETALSKFLPLRLDFGRLNHFLIDLLI